MFSHSHSNDLSYKNETIFAVMLSIDDEDLEWILLKVDLRVDLLALARSAPSTCRQTTSITSVVSFELIFHRGDSSFWRL